MQELDMYTVVVDNAGELATVVGTGNTYNYVYLSTNIQLTTGITIDPAKASLTIDGEYPVGQRHTLSDVNSTSADSTLGIRATSNIQITIRNMTIHGYNYYGLPYVTDGLFTDNRNVSVTYNNVTYLGPQITFHPTGLVRYINCDITIVRTGTASDAEEIAEANRIELGGRVTAYQQSTNAEKAVFWFRGDAATTSMTVLEDAVVEITSVNNYFMYSLDIWSVPTYVNYTIRRGGSLSLRTNRGISFNSAHRLASFTLEDNSAFIHIQGSANGSNASLYINTALTVGAGASFYMESAFAGAQPLINIAVTGARLSLNNPKSFVLYSSGAGVMSFAASTSTSFTLTAGQINWWNPATAMADGAGGFDDIPDYKWAKSDFSAFTLTGTAAPAATTVTGSTATAEELGNSLQLLQLHTARALSLGSLTVTPDPVVDSGRPVTGLTEAEALVRIEYSIGGVMHTVTGAADAGGMFSVATTGEAPANIPAGTVVTAWVNTPFLIAYSSETSVFAGELTLEAVPQHIRFATPLFTAGEDSFFRRYFPQDDEDVVVLDTRVYSTRWQLSVSISGDPQTSEGQTLPGSLVFRSSEGGLTALSTQPAVVLLGGPRTGDDLRTTILWPAQEGILLRAAGTIRLRTEYSTSLTWSVREAE